VGKTLIFSAGYVAVCRTEPPEQQSQPEAQRKAFEVLSLWLRVSV